jgi:hypothetical protein
MNCGNSFFYVLRGAACFEYGIYISFSADIQEKFISMMILICATVSK